MNPMPPFPTRKCVDREYLSYVEEVLTTALDEYEHDAMVSPESIDNIEGIRDTVTEMLDEQEEE
jgi:hypothetical protein